MSEQLSQEELDRFAAGWSATPVLGYFGFQLSFPERARVEIVIDPLREGQRGGLGTAAANGGIIAATYDFAIGCVPLLVPPLRRSATVQLSMSFERALRGSRLRCVARLDRATKELVFASASMFDEQGQECSRATGLVKLGHEVAFDEWLRALEGKAS